MLLLIAVFAILSVALLLFVLTKRQVSELTSRISNEMPPPGFRPLFAPTDDEVAREEKAKSIAAAALETERLEAESEQRVKVARDEWLILPDRHNTVELLRITAEGIVPGAFFDAAREVLRVFRANGIAGLSNTDLAALLDSHYRLIPIEERGSGDSFWLKEEVARLNADTVETDGKLSQPISENK